MRTASARDTMVARVQAEFAKYPSFFALPEYTGRGAARRILVANPAEQKSYVEALYRACAEDGTLAGRHGNDLVLTV